MEREEYEIIDLYQFEYQLIPGLIELTKDNTASPGEFLYYMSDLGWILNTALSVFKLKCNFDASDISVSCTTAHKKNFIIVFSFPNPKESSLAKFGAIVLNTNGTNYYTLEKFRKFSSENGQYGYGWILGSNSNGNHYNYGEVKDCSYPKEFVSLLDKNGFLENKSGFLKKFLIRTGLLRN